MLGKSQRFKNAGFDCPKYMLPIGKKSVFECVIDSFLDVKNAEPVILAVPDNITVKSFIAEKMQKYDLTYEIVTIHKETDGQADTVNQTISVLKQKPHILNTDVYIFNIDTFRFNVMLPKFRDHSALSFETFNGNGDGWSFAVSDQNGYATQVVEKKRVSKYCSTGMYHFSSAEIYTSAYNDYYRGARQCTETEHFIAPIYNSLIQQDVPVKITEIADGDIICCGTPAEYHAIINDRYLIELLNSR
jgi:dTDP-glucose pyrophosphorylase